MGLNKSHLSNVQPVGTNIQVPTPMGKYSTRIICLCVKYLAGRRSRKRPAWFSWQVDVIYVSIGPEITRLGIVKPRASLANSTRRATKWKGGRLAEDVTIGFFMELATSIVTL